MTRGLEKRSIKRLGKEVTFVGFGALEIGRNWGLGSGTEVERPDEAGASEVLNGVLDAGINLIDTASAYHRSEERIGLFVSDRRNEYILASKCGEHNNEPHTYYDFTYKAVKESIDQSLIKLKTDIIDIMQIHFGPDPEEVLNRGETVAAMKDARKEGKIRFLGASIDGGLATRCIRSGDFDVMQMAYSLLDQGNKENIRLAHDKGMGVFIRSGLAAGKLTKRVIPHLGSDFPEKEKVKKLLVLVDGDGDRLTELALNFLYNEPGVSSVLAGSKSLSHIKQNLELLARPLDQSLLDRALAIVNE
ncbi:aldo/keto reductase [Paenibacillus larvae]